VTVTSPVRISTRNARFQQWAALLTNRNKRQRAGEFLVQGVRPISLAVQYGWQLRALLYADPAYTDQIRLSSWARDLLDQTATNQPGGKPAGTNQPGSNPPGSEHTNTARIALHPDLLRELSEKDEAPAELLAVVALPPDDVARLPVTDNPLVIIFDRPASPGNIGTLIRSADAFGATGVVITGHAADPYDPKAVRASTGSLFAVPVVRLPSHREVLDWLTGVRAGGLDMPLVGADERGELTVADCDLTGPTALVIGNETAGLSAAWRASCDRLLRIPMSGSASSLNAASAGTVLLYDAARQRADRADRSGR
jgi:TrmH family RNA methyltransferase